MAKPVAYRVFTPPDTREELKRRIDAAPAEHADAILSAYRLLEEAHESELWNCCGAPWQRRIQSSTT
jgi:hypothetical protein